MLDHFDDSVGCVTSDPQAVTQGTDGLVMGALHDELSRAEIFCNPAA